MAESLFEFGMPGGEELRISFCGLLEEGRISFWGLLARVSLRGLRDRCWLTGGDGELLRRSSMLSSSCVTAIPLVI